MPNFREEDSSCDAAVKRLDLVYGVGGALPHMQIFRAANASRDSAHTSSNPMGHGKGATGSHNIMVGRVICLLVIAMARRSGGA